MMPGLPVLPERAGGALCRAPVRADAENLHRRNLKASEITRAIVRLYQDLYPDEAVKNAYDLHFRLPHESRQGLAELVGYSPGYVSQLWARRLLVDELVSLEDRGLLDRQLAQSLTRLSQQHQRQLAAVLVRVSAGEGVAKEEAWQAVREVAERRARR